MFIGQGQDRLLQRPIKKKINLNDGENRVFTALYIKVTRKQSTLM